MMMTNGPNVHARIRMITISIINHNTDDYIINGKRLEELLSLFVLEFQFQCSTCYDKTDKNQQS